MMKATSSIAPVNIGKNNVKFYLDYLDKEMTIMGILSSFCILSLALGIDRLVFYDTAKLPSYIFWNDVNGYCMIGLAGFLVAA